MTNGYFMGKLTVMDNLKPSISVLGNSNVCLIMDNLRQNSWNMDISWVNWQLWIISLKFMKYGYFVGKFTVMDNLKPSISVFR